MPAVLQITLDTVEVVLSGSAHQNEADDEGQALNDSLDAPANARGRAPFQPQ